MIYMAYDRMSKGHEPEYAAAACVLHVPHCAGSLRLAIYHILTRIHMHTYVRTHTHTHKALHRIMTTTYN